MHQIIAEIISSTKRRVKHIPHIPDTGTKQTLTSRNLAASIQAAKSKHHIPVIAEDVTPKQAAHIAMTMENAGAIAISVLTEPEYFHGSLENLEQVRKAVNIPVLRKDFIIDTRQLYEVNSDLILLIAGILGNRLPEFINLAQQRGLQPLVEVHNKAELNVALDTDAHIIGINNRNLKTMAVDVATTEMLAPLIKMHNTNRIIISESGISSPQDAQRVIQAGADAILVGTSIMKGDIYQNTKKLVEAGLSIS
jgi:indole-3-glycerol phosphate synthase